MANKAKIDSSDTQVDELLGTARPLVQLTPSVPAMPAVASAPLPAQSQLPAPQPRGASHSDHSAQKSAFIHAKFKGTYKVVSSTHAGMFDLKPFEITVKIPQEYQNYDLQAVFMRRCQRALHAKYRDAVGNAHRVELVGAHWPDGSPLSNPLTYTHDQLLAWISQQNVPIKPELYPELKDLRRMVKVWLEDPAGAMVIQDMEERMWGDDIRVQQQFNSIEDMVVE